MGKDQNSEYARLTDGSSDSSCECQRFEPRQPKRKNLWPWVLHGLMIVGYTLGSVFFIESQCGAKPWESEERKHVYCKYNFCIQDLKHLLKSHYITRIEIRS